MKCLGLLALLTLGAAGGVRAQTSAEAVRPTDAAAAAAAVIAVAAPTAPTASTARTAALQLAPGQTSADAWPSLRVLRDAERSLDAPAALRRLSEFQVPTGPHANLGPFNGDIWVHVPLNLAADAPGSWYLRLNYPNLHHVDVHVFDAQGRTVHHDKLGAAIAFDDRSQRTRALTSKLNLVPGQAFDVLLRIDSPTAILVPLAFMQAEALMEEESGIQALQGVLSGLWLFMMMYSAVNWVVQRQRIYLIYGLSLVSSWVFPLALHGVGAQYLWPNGVWVATHATVLTSMLMVAANARFLVHALDMRQNSPRTARVLDTLGPLSLLLGLALCAGAVTYRQVAIVAMALGILHLALAVPVAARLARRGDRPAAYMLVGVVLNCAGLLQLTLLLRGYLPGTVMSLHLVQFAFAIEMVTWMLALGARLQSLREAAHEAQRHHDRLDVQAHTDPLTGLLNRRGLERELQSRLARATAQHGTAAAPAVPLALFMLDLDGFKPINDRWGHDVGDLLLREVAARLSRSTRSTDAVARLGGDEFVVLVDRVREPADITLVGNKLLQQFGAPFDLGEGRWGRLGVTIGSALADVEGSDAADLMRRADAAMYRGKQSGKGVLVAAGAA